MIPTIQRAILTGLVAIGLLVGLATPAAWAADLDHGRQVFSTNCAACHAGGKNVVNGAKTLKIEDLEKYGMASIEAIKSQIANGKAAMPAFTGRLQAEDIDDVASYVLAQAEQGW